MKKIIPILLLLVAARSLSFGQEVAPTLAQGSKALLFNFSGLSFLGAGSYEGGFGGKYYISENTALRGALQLTIGSEDIPANPNPGQTGSDGSASVTGLGAMVALEFHMGKGRVSPYYGIGVSLNTTSTESKNAVVGNNVQTTVKNDLNGENVNGTTYVAGTTIGVAGILGVEVFLMKEVSLAAEYRLGFSSTSKKDEEVTAGNTTVTTKGGSGSTLGIMNNGLLTLAVYL